MVCKTMYTGSSPVRTSNLLNTLSLGSGCFFFAYTLSRTDSSVC